MEPWPPCPTNQRPLAKVHARSPTAACPALYRVTWAAADGFRLAVHHGALQSKVESEIKVIIPARTLNELNRLLGDQEEPVDIMMTPAKGQVLFRT